jgi:carboxymethylenebutenolidase
MRVGFPSGTGLIHASLHLPQGGPPRAGVAVIPDVWGPSDHYERVAARLAAHGYAALVLDLYTRGESPRGLDPAGVSEFIARLPDRQVLQDVQAGIDHLHGRPELRARRVGLTGFCMGGMYTWLAACRCRGLSAAVAWYGMLRAPRIDACNPEHVLDAVADLSCPALGLFGADDALIPPEQVAVLRRRAAARDLPLQVVVYPGAGHAFNNDTRPDAFRPEAAADGWRRLFELFDRELGARSASPAGAAL